MKDSKIWLAVTGILTVILGVLCIIYPLGTLLTLAWLLGLFVLCSGIAKLIFAMRTRLVMPNAGGRIFSALIQIVLGCILLAHELFVVETFAIIFAMWILVESITVFVHSFDYKKAGYNGWWLMMLFGILGIALGIAGLRAPALSAGTMSAIIGISIIAIGLAHLFALGAINNYEKAVKNMK
jgi:uncharacterized membrane protein HdeD (DUF308 family)